MSAPAWGRYAELHVEQLEAIMAAAPVAYLPWGALEWHGPHLPLGVDGITAEAVAERVVRRTGGVLLPTTWWPITALPHRLSLSIPTEVVRALLDAILAELARAGFSVVVILSGHYAQGHELVLMDAAEHALAAHGLLTLAVPPLALVDEQMLDHAAQWEVAQLLAIQPRLVHLEALDHIVLHPAHTAVLGDDPRGATAGQGEAAIALATERLASVVQTLLRGDSVESLQQLYTTRRAGYARYVEQYFRGSWEEAIDRWWRERCATP